LSDRFRVVDHLDILYTALDAIRQIGLEVRIDGCDLTDKRMYVRFICPELKAKASDLLRNYRSPAPHNKNTLKLGDEFMIGGLVLGNSEIGMGSHFIAPRFTVAACWNGMVRMEDAMRKVHLGQKMDEGVIEWSERTQEKQMELLLLQIKDAVKTFLSPQYMEQTIQEWTQKGSKPLQHPIDAVTNVCKSLALTDARKNDILSAFIKGGDATAFGITQALTWGAQSAVDGDDQFDMELAAVDILDKIEQYDKPIKVKAERISRN
jgi:hypothetical protein